MFRELVFSVTSAVLLFGVVRISVEFVLPYEFARYDVDQNRFTWVNIYSWFFIFLVHSAMLAHISFRQTSLGCAWFSSYFWSCLVRESSIYVMILLWFCSGALTDYVRCWQQEQEECSDELPLFVPRLLLVTASGYFIFGAILVDSKCRLKPRRLLMGRPGWQKNFVLGCLSASLIHGAHMLLIEFWESWLQLLPILLLGFSFYVVSNMMRNAAVHGISVWIVFSMSRNVPRTPSTLWIELLTKYSTGLVLVLIAGTAQTSRDTRIMVMLIVLNYFCLEIGSDYLHGLWFLIPFAFVGAYRVKVYTLRRREVEEWEFALGLLKYSEVKRRRAADPSFFLSRRQDMDPDIYGDPIRAKHIIAVSHAWLTSEHADPDGLHLDLVLSTLEEKYSIRHAASWWQYAWKRWWRYYYLESEGDILLFFDMSSLHQSPRTQLEDRSFKRALALVNFLYHSFDVLVISEIPDDVRYHGFKLSYMDKGWCWAEAQIASLGGKLDRYSSGFVEELERAQQQLDEFDIPLWDALAGYPKYPRRLLEKGKEHELMEYRRTQDIQGKIFTNGRFDMERVSQILLTVEGKRLLLGCLEAGDVAGVEDIFEDDRFFTRHERGRLTREELANTVFDGDFTTPLHLAVDADSPDLVRYLIAAGARPRRNLSGRFPWEWYTLVPSVSAAATAARMPPVFEAPQRRKSESWKRELLAGLSNLSSGTVTDSMSESTTQVALTEHLRHLSHLSVASVLTGDEPPPRSFPRISL